MFGLSSIKEFAESLALQIESAVPASQLGSKRTVFTVNKISRELEKVYDAARHNKKTHKLGFIKSAYMANTFRWALKEKGYPEDFITIATEGLVVYLTKNR
jgi:hypothetical protein